MKCSNLPPQAATSKIGVCEVARVVGRWRLQICGAIALPLIGLSVLTLRHPSLSFETLWLDWLEQHMPAWLHQLASTAFFAGDAQISALVVAIALGILAKHKRWLDMTTLAIAALGSLIWVDWVFKPWFAKDRPPFSHIDTVAGDAFPSGHAVGNLMLYLFLAYLLSERFPRWRGIFYASAIAFLLAMGLGSMLLRAHWPTDVVAGYGFGFIWLTVCLGAMRWLKCSRSTGFGHIER